MDSGFRRNDGSEYVGLIILTGYENFELYSKDINMFFQKMAGKIEKSVLTNRSLWIQV